MDKNKDFIIYQKKSKTLTSMILSLFMLIIGGIVVFLGKNGNDKLLVIIGLISLCFFGVIFIITLVQLIKGQKIIELTDKGFIDKSTSMSPRELIPWDDISKISIERQKDGNKTNEYVSVYLKNPEKFIQEQPSFKQGILKDDTENGLGQINISCNNTQNMTRPELVKLMNQYLKKYNSSK